MDDGLLPARETPRNPAVDDGLLPFRKRFASSTSTLRLAGAILTATASAVAFALPHFNQAVASKRESEPRKPRVLP